MIKKIKYDLFSIIFLIFSLSLLIYIFYKDFLITKDDTFIGYYLKYYIVAITLIIFSFISFKLNVELKKNISLSIFIIIIGLYLIEFYLSYKYHYEKIPHGVNLEIYNKKNKFDLYLDLKKSGLNIVPRIDPKTFFTVEKQFNKEGFFPLSGISNKITLSCNELGYFSKYKSDRFGFNNNDVIWDKNIVDVILIGDSFANGACVNRENNISENLIKNYDINTLNLGFDGNGPLIELATLKEYAPIKFKNIIWLYYEGNDLKDLEIEENNKTLKKYILDDTFKQNLKKKQITVDNFLIQKLKKIIQKEHLKKDLNQNMYNFLANEKNKVFDFPRFLKLYTIREITINSMFGIKLNKNFEKIILEAKNFADKNDANFLFVYIPEHYRFTKKIYNMDSHLNYKDVRKVIEKHKIKFLDLKKIFSQKDFNPKELYATSLGGHFNPFGYKYLSDIIYDSMDK